MKLFPILLLFSIVCFGQTNSSFDQRRDSIVQKGLDHYFQRDTVGLKEANKELQTMYIEHKDSLSLAKIYHFKALIYRIQYRLDSSYYYYHQSKNISILLKDSLEVGRRLLSMANMQNEERDYIGAEITIIEGLRYLEPLEEYTFTPHSLVALGNILTSLSRFSEARKYYNKASKLYKQNDSRKLREREELNILNNIGNTYLLEAKPKKAIEYLQKGLEKDSLLEKYPWHYKKLLGNYSESIYLLGRKTSAWEKFKELMSIRKKTNDHYGMSLSHNGIAYFYLEEGKKAKALFHVRKGYALAKQVNNNATRLSALLKLGALTSGNESKQYYQEYAKLNDSLNRRERYLKNQFAKVRYETEKKDKENKTLKQENIQKQQEAENERQQKIIFALLGVLGVVLIVVYSSNRRKKLMYEAQLQKASAREEERQQIAKSLHDEVAGDLRMLHQKLTKTNQEEAKSIELIKENVRNLSHQLSSVRFEDVSFKDQIINLISDAFSSDFRISVEGIDLVSWEEINSTIKRTLYLCIRESLQNTIKHAEATKFIISFSKKKKDLVVILEDNGKGIGEQNKNKGIGLKNLKERVEEIQGFFKVKSSKEGTKTNINLPIN